MMPPRQILAVARQTFAAWYQDNAFRLSAALAFYTVFSLAPLLLIAVAVAGLVFDPQLAQHQLAWQFQKLIGTAGAQTVEQLLAAAHRPRTGVIATIVSVGTLLLGATAVFSELQDALNGIWRVQPRPGRTITKLLRDRVLSFALVLSVGFLLLVSLVVGAVLEAVGAYASKLLPGGALYAAVASVAHTSVAFVVAAGLFGLMFKFLPDVHLRWRDVSVGGVVTAVLFSVGRVLIGLYLGRAGVGSPFGAAGSLVVLLVWVYYSSMILYLGAEFTRAWARARGVEVRPNELATRTSGGSGMPLATG